MGCLLAPGPLPQPVPCLGSAAVLDSEKGTPCWPLSGTGATASSHRLFLLCSALKTQSGAVTPPLPFPPLPFPPLPFPSLPSPSLRGFLSFQCVRPLILLCPLLPQLQWGRDQEASPGTPHPRRLPRSHQGQPCEKGITLHSLWISPMHQVWPLPRGCSQHCHWPVTSCQGNQAPPESWFKG